MSTVTVVWACGNPEHEHADHHDIGRPGAVHLNRSGRLEVRRHDGQRVTYNSRTWLWYAVSDAIPTPPQGDEQVF